MFKSKTPSLPPDTDYTNNLRETSFYRYGHLRSLGLTGEVTSLAVEPLLSLFAVGTSSGAVHVYGQPAFQFTLPVSSSGIKFLVFHPGHNRLVAVDDGNTIHSYNLQNLTDHINPLTNPPLPSKEGSYTLGGTITSVEQPVPSHTHMFFTMKDGSTLAWDLSRRTLASWRVGNCWGEYEERMVRSGIPGRRKTLGGPQATCIAANPRDLNIMLIGYEGGVIAWDAQSSCIAKTFEMSLPPGAPGGGSYQDADGSLWSERTPTVSCISWRPDGLVFVVGHSDGCLTFWAYSESDKPLMVRTITHEDVNVIDAESLLDAGALDNQVRRKQEMVLDREGYAVVSAVSANREPIFKLAWVSFPDQLNLKTIVATQDPKVDAVSTATTEYAERGETLLLILGGQSPGEKPGINILQFPAYQPLAAQRRATTPMSPSGSMPLQERYAYRDSLAPTGSSSYPTRTPPEDFVLLPRSSPYFSLTHDPVAIIVSLTPDPKLSRTDGPSAERGIEGWAFPPPRSNVIPPSPGRKHFIQPGEGEKLVAMSPVPVLPSSPMSPNTPQTPGWRLPWTTGSSPRLSPIPSSPTVRVSTPDSLPGPSRGRRTKYRRRYRLPSSLWSGNLAVLGCEVHSLPTPTFKRLISWSIETAGNEDVPRLSLYGGTAVPDLQSHGAPDVKIAKMESYRVLVTFHPDATIRFWDASPHILLLPTPLRFEYPGPLPHLTFSVGEYLKHPDIAHLPIAKLWHEDRSKVRIKSVHLAREALEMTITFVTGEIMVTKFGEAKAGARNDDDIEELEGDEGIPGTPQDSYFPPQSPGPSTPPAAKSDWVEEVTEVNHLANWSTDGFKPVAIFTLKRGEAVSCAVSDIGFLAVAFASRSIAILDIRGPDVILREGFDEEGTEMKKKRKKGNVQNVVGETSVVGAMKWVVSGIGSDVARRPRLIVSYAKGMTKIYCLANVLGEWMVEPKPPTFTNESLAGPLASFVLDPKTGNELTPSAESLQAAMKEPHSPEGKGKEKDTTPHCLWIAASRKSVRCAVNYNGDKVAKIELEEDELSEVFYITRHGQKVLVGITTTGSAMFWSMPFLQYITRMDLSYGQQGRRIGRISMDDRSGDFVEYSGPLDINLRTLFHFRKPYPPRLDPCSLKRVIPTQPVPLTASTMVGSWIWGGAPLTGIQLDTIIGGPNRPPPPRAPPPPKKALITWGDPPDDPVKLATPANTMPKRTAVQKQKAPVKDARERKDIYSEMTSAAAERGGYLDGLEDGLQNASITASNYLSSAKNAALKEAAKSTAKGMFGKLL